MEVVSVLGSTGSIGVSTLDVLREHPEKYSVFALTARSQVEKLLEQIEEFKPQVAVVLNEDSAQILREQCQSRGLSVEITTGTSGLCEVASSSEVDTVVAAIVGAAGLEPTMAAVRNSKKVLLANKESLVMAGKLFIHEVEAHGARLMPVDSEHNAIYQCLPDDYQSLASAGVQRIILTGSGGPFRTSELEALEHVTPEQAVAHPNWSMGKKISVDSATMMNKGLEFIEACWLFNARPEQIEVVLHPQSIVHSMVEYLDGSVLAQMGTPDMRTPIANCLAWPERIKAPVDSLNFMNLQMDFCSPDEQKFPCLRLAKEAMQNGGDFPAVVNAANEIAVEAFLNRQIRFTAIAKVVEEVMQAWTVSEPESLEAVKEADQLARKLAKQRLISHSM